MVVLCKVSLPALHNRDSPPRQDTEEGEMLRNAVSNWNESRWAFTQLVRTLGQMSAANAAVAGTAEIRRNVLQNCINIIGWQQDLNGMMPRQPKQLTQAWRGL